MNKFLLNMPKQHRKGVLPPPESYQPTGEATRESDRMAKENKTQRNLNASHRMTPYDAKVAGTFAQGPDVGGDARQQLREGGHGEPPRRPSPLDTHVPFRSQGHEQGQGGASVRVLQRADSLAHDVHDLLQR